MTFEELLKGCASGEMPKVKALYKIKYASSPQGTITNIRKVPNGHCSCSVRFTGMHYDTWFYTEDKNSSRQRYMKDLVFLEDE